MVIDAIRSPLPKQLLLANLAAFATYPLVGGLLVRALKLDGLDDVSFGVAIFAVFFVTNTLNFLLIAGPRVITHNASLRSLVRTLFIPMLPSEALAGALTSPWPRPIARSASCRCSHWSGPSSSSRS